MRTGVSSVSKSLGLVSLPQSQGKVFRGQRMPWVVCPGQPFPPLQSRGYILLNTWNSAFYFYPLCFWKSQSNALHPIVSKQNKHLLAGLFPILTLLNYLVRDSVCVRVCAHVCLCLSVSTVSAHVWYIFLFEWWHSYNPNSKDLTCPWGLFNFQRSLGLMAAKTRGVTEVSHVGWDWRK